MGDTIPRIALPTREVFYQEYVYPQRPVIVTGMFDGQPIRQINSLERCRSELGDMSVLVSEGYEDYASRVFRWMSRSGSEAGS